MVHAAAVREGFGERVQASAEPHATQQGPELAGDRRRAHRAPPRAGRVAKWSGSRANRPGTTTPGNVGCSVVFSVARSSIRPMSPTLTASWSRALRRRRRRARRPTSSPHPTARRPDASGSTATACRDWSPHGDGTGLTAGNNIVTWPRVTASAGPHVATLRGRGGGPLTSRSPNRARAGHRPPRRIVSASRPAVAVWMVPVVRIQPEAQRSLGHQAVRRGRPVGQRAERGTRRDCSRPPDEEGLDEGEQGVGTPDHLHVGRARQHRELCIGKELEHQRGVL